MFLHLIYALQTWTKQEQKHDLFCGLYQLLFSSFTRSPSRVSVSEETSPNLFHSMNSSVLAALNISLRRSASRRRLRLRRRARYKLALKSLNGPQVAFQMINGLKKRLVQKIHAKWPFTSDFILKIFGILNPLPLVGNKFMQPPLLWLPIAADVISASHHPPTPSCVTWAEKAPTLPNFHSD